MSSEAIKIPTELVFKCKQYAKQVVANYAAGMNPQSLAVSRDGAETNARLWADSKMAECAFCLWAGYDPLERLQWKFVPDTGWDVIFGRIKLDVKNAGPRSKYLIWPRSKNDFYETKDFDAMVLVVGTEPRFVISCWETKADFFRKKLVAGPGHVLQEGTWHMEIGACRNILTLIGSLHSAA